MKNFLEKHNLKKKLYFMNKDQAVEIIKVNKVSIGLTVFALLVMVIFGSMICGMKRQDNQQERLFQEEQIRRFQEEQEQLKGMTMYLDEIEKVILANRERLAETALFQSDTETILQTFGQSLTTLEQELMQVEKILQSHTESETLMGNEVSAALMELSESQQVLHSQIVTVHAGISDILAASRHENVEHFFNTFDKLKILQEDLDKTQEEVKSYYQSLDEFLILLQEENEENFTVTFEQLEKLQTEFLEAKEENKKQDEALREFMALLQEENNNNAAVTFEKLEILKEEMEKEQARDKEYYDSLTEFLSIVQEESKRQKEELSNQLLAAQTEMKDLLEMEFDSLQLKLEEGYLAFMTQMESLHQQVGNTRSSISELLHLMEEADEKRQAEIEAAFADVNASIELIRLEYHNAQTELENLIQAVRETQASNHEETLNVLSEVETSLEEASQENLEQLSSSLQTIEENFANSMNHMQEEINENFSQLNRNFFQSNADIVSKMEEMDTNSYHRSEELKTSITNQNEELKTNITNQNQELKTNITNQNQELKNSIANQNRELKTSITNQTEELKTSITNQNQELRTSISNQYKDIATTINHNSGNQQESFNNLMNFLEQKLGQVFTYVSNGKKKVVSALLTKGVSLNEDATFAQIQEAILDIEQELLIGVEQIPGEVTYQYHYHVDGKGQNPHAETCGVSANGGCYTAPFYHYHTDVEGTMQAAGYVADEKGGCFTTDVCHEHVGTSEAEYGCYTVPNYHVHLGDNSKVGGCYGELTDYNHVYCTCYWYVHGDYGCDSCHHAYDMHWGTVWPNGGCDGIVSSTPYTYIGLTCGKDENTIDSYSVGCGMDTSTVIGYSVGCGKTDSTVAGYQTGCGMSDGQIVGAVIVYDQSMAGSASMMSLQKPKEEAVTEVQDILPTAGEPETEASGEEIY